MPTTPVTLMVGLLLVGGFFRSLQFTAINALSFADVTRAEMSQATTMTSVAQQIAVSLGITVGAIVAAAVDRGAGGEITGSVLAGLPDGRRADLRLGHLVLDAGAGCRLGDVGAPAGRPARAPPAGGNSSVAAAEADGDQVELDRLRRGSPAA